MALRPPPPFAAPLFLSLYLYYKELDLRSVHPLAKHPENKHVSPSHDQTRTTKELSRRETPSLRENPRTNKAVL
jgi:hypothetical protein